MRIAVCVKHVPEGHGHLDPTSKRLDRSGEGALNHFDANAVEEALRLKGESDTEVVVVSLGPQKATIPHLTDRSIRAARIELLRSGLQAGEISSLYLPGYDDDAVLQQDPAPGTSDVTSPHVDMLVSLGSRPPAYVMPDVMGLNLMEAEQRLAGTTLHIGKITVTPEPGALHGTVLSQAPAHGARVEQGSAIDLQVAE